ncbi:Gldg family protein [bacterium]|nr:Gldg family protein [bacterium]
MSEKKPVNRLSNAAYVAIIIGIVAVVNLLGVRFFGRLDLTGNKLYSVSPVTKGILHELDDVVSVKAYFSKKLPVQISRLPEEVGDLLKEYQVYSHGNIHYERVDPADDEALQQKLAGLGVTPVTMTIIEKDERQQINGWLAIVVSYGDKSEAIPVVQNTGDLEYDLTSRIFRVTSTPDHVGFITTYSRHDLGNDYRAFAQELSKLHEIQPVDLNGGVPVPDSLPALIFAGPTDSVPDYVQYALDQYVMHGGKLICLVDDIRIDDSRGQPYPIEVHHGMDRVMMSWGFTLGHDVVQDPKSHSPQQVNQGIFTINRPNPFFPHVVKAQLGKHPVVGRLSEITFPYTGSINEPVTSDSSVVYSVLAWTSEAATSHRPPTYQPAGAPGRLAMAVLGTGRFKSAFAGPVVGVGAASPPFAAESPATGSILMVANSNFLENRYLYPGNLEFMLNAVDYMTIGDKLISIRTRPTTDRPLKSLGGEMKNFLRLLNIVGVPLLVILFGMMRFYLKRRDKAVRAHMQG